MSLITKPQIQALQTGFDARFRQGYNDAPISYTRYSMTIPSNHKVETYGWMTRIPKMREWIGARKFNDLETEEYVVHNKTYENSIAVDVDDIADDALGVYNPMMEELGRTSREWADDLVTDALQAGTTETSFDGLPFFSASHDVDPAGVQSNLFTSTALNATNFDTVRAAMSCYTANDGKPLAVMPRLLLVPPQLEKAAREIVAAERGANGSTNVQDGMAEVLVVPKLCNEPTVWYLIDTSRAIKPLLFQQRQAPKLAQMTADSDEGVFMENQLRWGTKARGAGAYGLWWFAARCAA